MINKKSRESFTTNFGVLTATLSSAVGLGNIWRFPYLTGTNGGAGFIIFYIIATLLVGLPIMIFEIMLGRKTKQDAITTMKILAPIRQPWWLISLLGVLTTFLILAFYSEVAGWVFYYTIKAFQGNILSSNPEITSATFQNLVSSPFQALACQWIALGVIGTILLMGVTKGIEAVTKKLMPILFLLLVAISIRSIMLPGAAEGLVFLFKPDFSKIDSDAALTALGLAFFKLSIGMGTMITYGSYFRDNQNIPKTALQVISADLFVSLLAGIAIFPAVFAFGFIPEAGPSLVFITIPAVFTNMPFGHFSMVVFFILTSIAALGAMLSMLEVPVSVISGQLGWSRPRSIALSLSILVVLGAGCALSESWTAKIKIFDMNFFNFFDFLTSKIFLPLGGIFICAFVGRVFGLPKSIIALGNERKLKNEKIVKLLFFILRFISPILIIVVMLKGLKLF